MRVSRSRLYPYPIYSELTDHYVNNDFSVDADIEYDSENATVTLFVSLLDEQIRDLVNNRLVGLFCHVECSSTKYRELFEISVNDEDGKAVLEIPLYKLNDTVEVMCVLVAKEDIDDFKDDNLSELYRDEVIHFPRYGTIGYTDTTEMTLVKRIDVNGDVPSIFQVCEDTSGTLIQTDYNQDQIFIYLPKDQYEIYENYKGRGVRVKQMMLIIPALIEAIDQIKNDQSDYSDLPWYIVIEEAVRKKGYQGFDDESFKSRSSYEIAQEILGDVAKEAFDEFDRMNKDAQG